jgi:hypothetical protein
MPFTWKGFLDRVFVESGASPCLCGFDIGLDWLWREIGAAGELTQVADE